MLKKDLELLVKNQQKLIDQLAAMVSDCGALLEELHKHTSAALEPMIAAKAAYEGVARRLEEARNAQLAKSSDKGSSES